VVLGSDLSEKVLVVDAGQQRIRAVIGSDTRFWRDGLADVLRRRQIAVLGVAAHAADLVDVVEQLSPDVVLLDVALPDSIGAVREIATRTPQVRVVALGIREREDEIIACAEAGVAGYVTRDDALDDLVEAIQTVLRGEMRCSARLAATLLRRVTTLAADRPVATSDARLTARELEVSRLLDDGLSNKQIAQQLQIELPTVKNHVHNILEKLSVHRRSEATALMRRSGMLSG
jgi:two-component system, NarL family, nitrate/nitrite response regulator NarL